MARIDKNTPAWELEIEKQIREEAGGDSVALEWLDPMDPLFAIPDIPQRPEPEHDFIDPEYEKIQSMPYNEFDEYWEKKMMQQRKENSGGNKGSVL
jgi:hypothetical protein